MANLKKDSSGKSLKEDLSNEVTFDPCKNPLDLSFNTG
jgi:hypothetical protein